MSDSENPYQSPESPIIPETSQDSGMPLTNTMLQYLVEASPWLRFMGVIGFIGSALCCIGGIISSVSLIATSSLLSEFANFPVWIFPLIQIPMGLILFFPAYFLFKFGQKIRTYQYTHSNEDLESGFKYNKSYWKFMGILCIIYLAAIPFIIIIATIAGVALALNM
jgi:hypothetical protein